MLAPAGNAAYTAGADGTLKVWQLPPVAARPLAGHGDAVLALAVSADGAVTVTGCADKSVRVFQTDNGQLVRTLPAPESIKCVAIAGAGKNAVIAAGTVGGQLLLWGGDAKPLFQGPAHTGEVTSLSFNPSANGLVSVGADGNLKFWALPIVAKNVRVLNTSSRSALFMGDGQRVLAGGSDKTVKLVDLATGKDGKTLATLPDVATALAISRDGQQIAAAAGKLVKVWNNADGKEIQTLTHPAAVVALGFSPDHTRLATGTTDNLARVWDLATGQEVASLQPRGSRPRRGISSGQAR